MEKYDNLGMVGEGSYGMVMKCKHKESGQIVAIKKFLESEDDKMVKKIAMREVRMLRKLRHENLVNLIEVFRRRKRLYLVFEFVDHTVLDDLEKYPNGLNEMTVRKILWQVLRGVEFCHSHNIIHRDIKPENILNSRSGVIKLCDFGFARTLAAPGEVYTDYVATRWYRAPELLVGDTKYGRAIDIWAIGCLVGEMLQGDPIFPGKSDIDQLNRILKPVDIWAVGCLITEMLTGDPLFPGDSDIDQLYHIIKCFGNLCPRHREIFQRNPLFAGMRLPDVRDVEPLERKFPKFSFEVLDLMKQCLRLDPNDRPSSSLLLRHEFFKKDGFEEKVIPELRARIMKDLANNVFTRKEANEKKEQERERKKKKNKELASNNVPDAKDVTNIATNKKSPDHKNLTRTSPDKHTTPSPKKDNLPKSIIKAPVTTPPAEDKKQRKDSEKERKQANVSKQLPVVEQSKPVSTSNVSPTLDTPRPKYVENSPKNQQKMPQIKKKKSMDESHSNSVQTSLDGATKATPNGILKNSPSKKSSTKKEAATADASNSLANAGSGVRSAKQKDPNLTKTSSDTLILKEKQNHAQADKPRSTEKSYNIKGVKGSEQHKRDHKDRGPSRDSESPSKQTAIPPIASLQTSSKASTPDPLLIVNSSTTSSPHSMSNKQIPITSYAGPPAFRGSEKVKKSSQVPTKKNEITTQGTFDRSMYPDKTSHFEKMMMSMSGATSITHPAIKKTTPSMQSGLGSFNTSTGGTSGMQYLRHYRDDKPSNLPLWSSGISEDKHPSLQSSVDSKPETKHKHMDEYSKLREKSPKPSKKEVKSFHLGNEDKTTRDIRTENRMRLPDLGHKPLVSQDRDHLPDLRPAGIEIAPQKIKKPKKSMLTSIPSLDHSVMRSHQKSRSPSPSTNHMDSNFPSVHSKN